MLIFNTEKADFWETLEAIPVIHLALFSAPLAGGRVALCDDCTYDDPDGERSWH